MLHEHIKEAYDKLDLLRERLEFIGLQKEQQILEEAREALNRYLAVVEKFDQSKP
jgi:hypothetical protein